VHVRAEYQPLALSADDLRRPGLDRKRKQRLGQLAQGGEATLRQSGFPVAREQRALGHCDHRLGVPPFPLRPLQIEAA